VQRVLDRQQPLALAGAVLDLAQRLAGLQTGIMKRCPGAASQPATDGSAPFRDSGGNLDCDPTQVVAGP
jgi:phospholipid/cholesterol/gamma-HCH transport system substrate-binding protein